MTWPPWWSWELELAPHVEKRMEERSFTEVDLRAMLEGATLHRPDHVEGRFAAETRHGGRLWHAIVELDVKVEMRRVVTCYPLNRR